MERGKGGLDGVREGWIGWSEGRGIGWSEGRVDWME